MLVNINFFRHFTCAFSAIFFYPLLDPDPGGLPYYGTVRIRIPINRKGVGGIKRELMVDKSSHLMRRPGGLVEDPLPPPRHPSPHSSGLCLLYKKKYVQPDFKFLSFLLTLICGYQYHCGSLGKQLGTRAKKTCSKLNIMQ